jgi:hypothetical protein
MISNNFDDFIAKFIDTYLFSDLKTIHDDIHKTHGNLAYLYIFAICSSMEFLGTLLREESPVIDKRIDSSNALGHYIKNYLIPVSDNQHRDGYKLFQKIAPVLIRNGLAHCYAPKGPIAVGRYNHAYKHLSVININSTKQLFINADVLYEDFKRSYDTLVKPMVRPDGDLYDCAKKHYEEIRTVYKNEVDVLLLLP